MRSFIFGFLCCLSTAFIPVMVSAAWIANGTPVKPGILDEYGPSSVSIAPDERGGAYVVSGSGIFDTRLNRILGSGDVAAGWTVDGEIFYGGALWPFFPVVIPDDRRGAFVITSSQFCLAHCTNNPTQLRVQHMTSTGQRVEDWPPEGVGLGSDLWQHFGNLNGSQPVSIPNGHGSAIITWARQQTYVRWPNPNPVELRAQRVDGDSAKPWGEEGILVHSFATRQYDQTMAPDGFGGAYVFWLDDRSPGVYAQHITEAGRILWAADGIPVPMTPFTGLGRPVAVPDGSHGAIVAWVGSTGGRAGVFAARVTPGGLLPWRGISQVFRSGATQAVGLRMVPSGGGGAILAWRDSLAGAEDRILAQRLDHGGNRQWPEYAVTVCAAPGARNHVALADDRRGGAYVAWLDSRPDFGVFGMHLERTGEPARGWPRDGAPICARLPRLASVGGQAEFTALEITTIGRAGNPDTAPEVDARDASAASGILGDGESLGRSDQDGAERTEDRVAGREADAIVAWLDDRMQPCAGCDFLGQGPFAMLLTPHGPAAAPSTPPPAPILENQPEYSRTPAGSPVFSLTMDRTDAETLRLSLLDSSPASLELFDLAGRRLWSREVGELGPGEHEVRIGNGAWYPSGVYMARLQQGSRAARVHVAVIH
jgi:hypothetical protein